jgi:serine/threonine-protein kinase
MLASDSQTFPLLDGVPQRALRLRPGDTVAGQFVIEGLLGRGGMGEVYRCRDTILGRTVALKVLPERIAQNSDAMARFRREAQLLASLNHSNIAVIHSTEQVDGVHALVLEFIDGPTLTDLIASGPVPAGQALSIARQIADALETAHEAGIIHRDLKPANVKVRPDGTIKVLDFGLAKSRGALNIVEARGGNEPCDPALTDGYALLGTAAYMSPEQARGEQVDRRADIWAFGVVLYEMFSGRPLFVRETTGETLRAVLQDDIDWCALPPATPAAVQTLIRRCLERDFRRRLRDIGEARIALEDATVAPEANVRKPRGVWILAGALVAALAVAGGVFWISPRPTREPATRFRLLLSPGPNLFANRSTMAISSDGRQVVYANAAGLHLRDLSALEPVTIRGTAGFFNITEPVFSPDGKWIAFQNGTDGMIKKVPVGGGTALNICASVTPSSVTWGKEGLLFVEPGNAEFAAGTTGDNRPRDGILLVSPEGGEPKHLVRRRNREVFQRPQFLPGGRKLLLTIAEWNSPDAWDKAQIVVHDVATGERTVILQGGTDARFLPAGYIVYAVAGNLVAAPFDVRRLRLTGPAVPVVEGVMRAEPESTGGAQFSIATNGTLLYAPGPVAPSKQIVITDRNGSWIKLPLPPAIYDTPRVSPRGDQIAFGITERGKSDIYVYDLSGRNAMRRLTVQGNNRLPAWSSDGARIAYQSDREGDRAIFAQRADGSGPVQRLTTAAKDEFHEPEAWSHGDDVLLFSIRRSPGTSIASAIYRGPVTLSALSLRDGSVRPFDDLPSATPAGAVFSPDGRWVAYASTSTVPYSGPGQDRRGRTTIIVQPFPPTGARYELAHDGRPNHPQWSPDGKELFFIPGPEQFKSVPVTVRPTFSFGNAAALPRPSGNAHTLKPRAYDVLPDGRFIGAVPLSYDFQRGTGQLVVVLNWFSELQARLAASK